jgi:hypothetical protein
MPDQIQKLLDYKVLLAAADSEYYLRLRDLGANLGPAGTRDVTSALCRSLRDRGYLRYERGLFNEDWTAGSGYIITDKGHAYLAQIHAEITDDPTDRDAAS